MEVTRLTQGLLISTSIVLLLIIQAYIHLKVLQNDEYFTVVNSALAWLHPTPDDAEEEFLIAPHVNRWDECTLPNGTNITMPQLPTFIIAGASKCGTTALHELFNKVPHVMRPRKFESHFFNHHLTEDLKYQGRLDDRYNLSTSDLCHYRAKYYERVFLKSFDREEVPPESIFFEKTPKYICFPDLAKLIKRMLPWVKIVVMLRNPIERAYSEYKQEVKLGNKMGLASVANMTFEEALEKELEKFRQKGISIAPDLVQFTKDEQERRRRRLLDTTTATNEENGSSSSWVLSPEMFALPISDMSDTNRSNTEINVVKLGRGMYAQQLAPWLEHFELSRQLLVLPYEEFEEDQANTLDRILGFVGAPPTNLSESLLKKRHLPVARPKNDPGSMRDSTRDYLEHFYRPYNDELADLLGEEWRNKWF
mmetsp:Transcript_9766/g.14376  ORF Transcript_9766/g.14376 Transcript_9766/m.14376 type:complete len:423 (+) Transcript_9766:187-1455(+)